MPLHIEATAVIALKTALDNKLEDGFETFRSVAPCGICYADDFIALAGFMSPHDAEEFVQRLELRGLHREENSPELTVVHAQDQKMNPICDWLILFDFQGHLIATMKGNDSRTVIAREGWSPDEPPSLQHLSADQVSERLEFVERKDKVDVYRDRETGQLLYSARTTETPDEIYERASDVVWKYNRTPGAPPTAAPDSEDLLKAIGELQTLAASHPESWRSQLMLGKAWFAMDKLEQARNALERAHEQDVNTFVMKELAGVYLELTQFRDACQVGEQAVAIEPDNIELLGNLAVAYLLNGELEKSQTTIQHATGIDANDSVNGLIAKVVKQVIDGKLQQPATLAEVASPPKKPGLLKRWFGK